jgi:hypothetical protein
MTPSFDVTVPWFDVTVSVYDAAVKVASTTVSCVSVSVHVALVGGQPGQFVDSANPVLTFAASIT